MDEEQLNEEINVSETDLDHLKHISKRIKNLESLTEKTLQGINQKNFLSVTQVLNSTSGENL